MVSKVESEGGGGEGFVADQSSYPSGAHPSLEVWLESYPLILTDDEKIDTVNDGRVYCSLEEKTHKPHLSHVA